MNLSYADNLDLLDKIEKIRTFLKFSFSSGVGVFINLLMTFILAEFLFGRQNYFYAYLIGLTLGLLTQFILHIKYTFQNSNKIGKKFGLFMSYSIMMTIIQASAVKIITDSFGFDYYMLVITSVICIFYIINYLINKKIIFK